MVEQVVDVGLRRDLELLPFADGADIPAQTQIETEEGGEADLVAVGETRSGSATRLDVRIHPLNRSQGKGDFHVQMDSRLSVGLRLCFF